MRLTEVESHVLVRSQLEADLPAAEIARILKIKEHTVRRAQSRILDAGVFGRRASLNLSPLGLHEFNMYFSLTSKSLSTRRQLFSAIGSHSGIKWLLEMTGGYDGLVAILSPTFHGVAEILDSLTRKYGNFLFAKEITSVVSFVYFGRRYLAPRHSLSESLSADDHTDEATIDEIDKRILRALTEDDFSSFEIVARKVKIPASTLRLRYEKLRQKGIIIGMIYNIKRLPPGIHAYRIQIYLGGFHVDVLAQLKKLAQSEPGIVYIVRTIGSWDYELQYEGLDSREIVEFCDRLTHALGQAVINVVVRPIVDMKKRNSYPFPIGDEIGLSK